MPIFHEVLIVANISLGMIEMRGFDSMSIFHKVMIVCLYFTRF